MIVIAIIGILAAIAIPNFISYRDKAYCTATEKDAGSISAAIANYFSDPLKMTANGLTVGNLGLTLSYNNTMTVTQDAPSDAVTIAVTDASVRCPSGTIYTMVMGGDQGVWK